MTFANSDIAAQPDTSQAPPFFVGFTLTLGAAYGYAAGWNPFASDFSRYLPKNTSKVQIGFAAGLGNFLSTTILMSVGAALALTPGFDMGNPTASFVAGMPTWFGAIVLLGIAVGAEGETLLLQFAAQLAEIVDLAIEDEHNVTISAAHRLMTCFGEVLDAQARKTKATIRAHGQHLPWFMPS